MFTQILSRLRYVKTIKTIIIKLISITRWKKRGQHPSAPFPSISRIKNFPGSTWFWCIIFWAEIKTTHFLHGKPRMAERVKQNQPPQNKIKIFHPSGVSRLGVENLSPTRWGWNPTSAFPGWAWLQGNHFIFWRLSVFISTMGIITVPTPWVNDFMNECLQMVPMVPGTE